MAKVIHIPQEAFEQSYWSQYLYDHYRRNPGGKPSATSEKDAQIKMRILLRQVFNALYSGAKRED